MSIKSYSNVAMVDISILEIEYFHKFTVYIIDTKGELPPSFCNGLRTVYIASFRGRSFWSYY